MMVMMIFLTIVTILFVSYIEINSQRIITIFLLKILLFLVHNKKTYKNIKNQSEIHLDKNIMFIIFLSFLVVINIIIVNHVLR